MRADEVTSEIEVIQNQAAVLAQHASRDAASAAELVERLCKAMLAERLECRPE